MSNRSLNDLAEYIHTMNVDKGFWPENKSERNVGEALMLIVSELGEGMEAHRKGRFAHSPEIDTNSHTFSAHFEERVKDSFEDELADAIIRILDLSAGLNIDIEKHINLKLKYNQSRPYLHGKQY